MWNALDAAKRSRRIRWRSRVQRRMKLEEADRGKAKAINLEAGTSQHPHEHPIHQAHRQGPLQGDGRSGSVANGGSPQEGEEDGEGRLRGSGRSEAEFAEEVSRRSAFYTLLKEVASLNTSLPRRCGGLLPPSQTDRRQP